MKMLLTNQEIPLNKVPTIIIIFINCYICKDTKHVSIFMKNKDISLILFKMLKRKTHYINICISFFIFIHHSSSNN